ncbi:hypothetical protein ACLOJK_031085 [Asimina triloba]
MKIRSLKLKEAHKSAGASTSSFCSLLYDPEGDHLVTSASSDPSILIHDFSSVQSPKAPKVLTHHKDGVSALALSPNSTCLASGSLDHSVKLYSFPGGEFQTNITRFTLPIRTLAFNRSGSLLAAAGDDEGIKLIATIDGSISRVLKGHKGSVTCLAFDPNNEYLASVDGIGTVIFWELSSGNQIHNLKGIAPRCGSDASVLNVVSWSPDGETLAVPGLKNDVVMYDRDTAEKLFSLRGDHAQSVCSLAWSPNGKYMATSGMDRQVLIWDVDQRQDIDRQKFDDRICCLVWKPNGNALAVIDVMGKFGMWESPVPSCMKSPIDGAPLQSKSSNGFLLLDEDDPDSNNSGSLSDIGEDSQGESAPVTRKRLRKHSILDEDLEEDSGEPENLLPRIELRKKSHSKVDGRIENGKVEEELGSSGRFKKIKMQEAFQPGSTPVQAGKRHFLCYNMLGSITTIENEGYSHIEVDFHDTGRGPRVPSMTDYFDFTMASLNETGSVFGNPCKGEKNMSTLMYRPFGSWANNTCTDVELVMRTQWSMRFEAEEVKAVALGTGWIAAITSLNYVRIFTEGGLQRHILSLDGPVVTASGSKNELAVVIHASDCLSSGDQILEFKVFNIADGTQPISGRLPLTPGSCLSWFGFSEDGQLSSYDSKVTPKPVLTLLSLSFPIASSDLGADSLENEFMMINLHLSQTRKKLEEMEASGMDSTGLDDEAFNMEAALDRCILRLIAGCCNGDKLVRAMELARLLSLEKSLKGAIKLVTALKLPILADRFNGILEERLLGSMAYPASASNASIRSGPHGCLPAAEDHRPSGPSTPMIQPRLPTSQFSKHETLDDKLSKLGGNENDKNTGPPNAKEGSHGVQFHPPTDSFSKVHNNNEKSKDKAKAGEGKEVNRITNTEGSTKQDNKAQFQRPTNPFVKASTNQEKSSLFSSLKKMKQVDGDKGGAKRK